MSDSFTTEKQTALITSYTKINSFSRRISVYQFIVYLASVFQILTSYIIIQHRLESHLCRTVFLIMYTICLVIKIGTTFATSAIDPSDRLMVLQKTNPKSKEVEAQIAKIKHQIGILKYCRQCSSFIKPESHHCRRCRRCVQELDHHCIWINNCIGKLNYTLFIWMICSVQAEMIVYIVGGIVLWLEGNYTSYQQNHNITQNQYRFPIFQMVIVWIVMAIVAILSIMNLVLIVAHIYLVKKGMTTREWLTGQRSAYKNKSYELMKIFH